MIEDHERDSARGQCPACGMPTPFARTVARRGKPFACPACGTSIEVAKVDMTSFAMIAGVLAIAQFISLWPALIALVFVMLIDWKWSRVNRAAPDAA